MRWPMLALIPLLILSACLGDDPEDLTDILPTATPETTSMPLQSPTPAGPTATTQIIEPSPTPEPTATATATEPEPTATEVPPTATSTSTSEPTATQPVAPATGEPTTGDSAGPTATGDATATTGGDVGARPEDELALSLLLDEGDLPDEWTLIERGTGDFEDSEEGLCGALPISRISTPSGVSEAAFQVSDLGPFLQEGVAIFESEGEAIAGIEYIRETLTCTEWTQTDGGDVITWTITPLDMPTIGDDTVANQISFGAGEFTLAGDYILLRQDRALILLVTLSIDEPVPTATTINIAETAVTRVDGGL